MENDTVEHEGAEAMAAAAAGEAPETGELHATTEAHGGEEHAAFPPFAADTFGTQLIWLALSFAVLYFVLSRLALPRIGAILDDRKARIDTDLGAAEAWLLEILRPGDLCLTLNAGDLTTVPDRVRRALAERTA